MNLKGLLRGGILAVGLSLIVPSDLPAHADLEEQIATTTKLIEQQPGNAALYLRRGELHRLHREWIPARLDYDRAERLDPALDGVDMARGHMLLDAGQPEAAAIALTKFLERMPRQAEAHALRARARVALKDMDAAVADYDAAVADATESAVEYCMERAQLLASMGRLEEAVRGLDAGIAKLGELPALESLAIDLDVTRKAFDSASARMERMMALSPRKETWLARRAEIEEKAGKPDAARISYTAALNAIEQLPASRRHVAAVEELEKTVHNALRDLDEKR